MASTEQKQTTVCYRHTKRETAVSCSECGRPICTECMVFASVGIKCPACAGQQASPRRAAAKVRTAALEGSSGWVTKALIAANVLVFLVEIAQASIGNPLNSAFAARFAIFGPAIANGDWWRIVTGGFLHASLLHIAFNMLALWWFGRPLEALVGPVRFAAIYAVSLLAGSAGALLFQPRIPTVGASGAVFGILGAGLLLERRRIYVFGGSALIVVAFNLAFSLFASNVSIGGHIGGLVGGIVAMLVLMRFGRGHAAYGRFGIVEIAGLAAIAAVSIAIAYARVRGLA